MAENPAEAFDLYDAAHASALARYRDALDAAIVWIIQAERIDERRTERQDEVDACLDLSTRHFKIALTSWKDAKARRAAT